MAKTTRKYDNESIQALKGPDRVRRRPSVIFGSDGLDGCKQSIFEILSNSLDESREGYGEKIILTQFLDDSIEIEDFASGIPVDFNQKENEYNWKLLFCELYAGGKYENLTNGSYEYSLGINGLGLCATQYSSEYMTAEIRRDGHIYNLRFEKGEAVGDMQKTKYTGRQTGTKIRWRPDLEVFTEISIEPEYFENIMKKQAIVNAGVTLVYKRETEKGFVTNEYFYPNGIADYVAEGVGQDPISSVQYWEGEKSGRDREDRPEYKVKMSVAFCFSNQVQCLEYYHNSSFLEYGGSPERALKTAFIAQVDALLKDKNLYRKGESKISFVDIEGCLYYVSSSYSAVTSYENQTKKAITNRFITQALTEFLKQNLEIYFLENRIEADKIAEQVLINKRSREKAEETRQNLKKTLSASSDLTNRIQKFVDCRTKDLNKRELYIVEGDSALGACKQGRDAEFQALMPVRGKILNCLKADYGRIFKNEIITDLVKVLGCGVEVSLKQKGDLSTFSLDSLKWNKVIICTDADYDGFQIRTLILTMLYRLVPTLISEGFVYIAESPLYEITTRNKVYFAYSEYERAEIMAKLSGERYTLQRSKGLGENEAEMMWMTTMNPETRRLIKITTQDAEDMAEAFDLFLGDNLVGRKNYIAEHGSDYLDDIDLVV
ncbi:MAG: toprim domain-containing protein [Oscillospiraceae bacterium]|nr:toprim domain-containing protein [Oscillospiraceae bacterium]